VIPAAAALVACLLLLALVVPDRLARAAWAPRSPGLALLLWQALGLAGGLLAIEAAVTVALSAAGPTHLGAVDALRSGDLDLPVWSGIALAVGVLVLLRLLSVLLASAARTLRARHENRVLVDLVSTRNPLLPGARVVEHALPLAYCLPGLRPRVVLSSGVLALLREDEVRAVLAHEAAHVDQRHDLVVLPFVALRATFPGLRGVRTAVGEVGLLVEMLADDRAARGHSREVLARALYKVGSGTVPAGGLGAAGGSVLLRAQRLLEPPAPLPLRARAAVLAATAGVLALAPLGLLLPVLVSR
jgi:Zn-dependent protease with chaperone function